MSRARIGRDAFYVFLCASALHLVSQIVAPVSLFADVTQVFIVLPLAVVVWATARPGMLATTGIVALLFSWLGDTVPRFLAGDGAFLAMLGFFLLSQVTFAIAFVPDADRSILRKPLLVVPYALAAVALVAWCAGPAGGMLPAVIAYAIVIVTMAVLATGLGSVATVGGLLFLLSDSLIAVRTFPEIVLPFHGFWVMVTYIAAEGLLAFAIVARSHRGRARVSSRRRLRR